jgi:putative tricarboxylic transport membrane protein
LDYPLAPLIVALVLGASTEEALRQSLIMSDGSMLIFFQRPLSAPIMVAALLLFMLPLIQMAVRRYRRRQRQEASAGD